MIKPLQERKGLQLELTDAKTAEFLDSFANGMLVVRDKPGLLCMILEIAAAITSPDWSSSQSNLQPRAQNTTCAFAQRQSWHAVCTLFVGVYTLLTSHG